MYAYTEGMKRMFDRRSEDAVTEPECHRVAVSSNDGVIFNARKCCKLAEAHYQDADAVEGIVRGLMEVCAADIGKRGHVPFFVMVGADSSTGDCLGPFVGWFLQRKGFAGLYLGDLSDPVHAGNLKEKIDNAWTIAMKRNVFPYIVAVDAAVGTSGRILISSGPLKPGAGMGKTLPQVGVAHILAGTAPFPFMIWFTSMNQTVAMAEVIADALIEFDVQWRTTQARNTAAAAKEATACGSITMTP